MKVNLAKDGSEKVVLEFNTENDELDCEIHLTKEDLEELLKKVLRVIALLGRLPD